MGQFKYITNRTVKNQAGEEKGKIKVIVKAGSDTAEVDYTCPGCLNAEHTEQPWIRPFSVRCAKCGLIIKLSRLKDEIKREKKMAKSKI